MFYIIISNPTSDRKPLRVGSNKSVFVTFTFDEKLMSINVSSLLYSLRNLVWVLNVEHGRGQSDTRLPSIKPYISPKV